MTDIAELGLTVDSRDVRRATGDLGRFGKEAKQASGAATQMEKSSGGMATAVRGAAVQLAAFAGAAMSVRKALEATEVYTGMQNRLLALGASHEEAAAQIAALGEIANSTRAPIDATAQLYTRMSVGAKSLGASQQELLAFTENVGLALASSGTSASQASGALIQLSQAMSGGVVRAEEFNSILEGAPGILIAAANGIDGVNGDLGALRQLMLDGELTSRAFFDALLSQSAQLEASFSNTAPTISQALTVMNNSFTLFIGEADQATGVTTGIAQAILVLAENMDVAIPIFGAVGIAIAALAAPVSVALLAIGGLAVAVVANWDKIKAAFDAGVDYVKGLGVRVQTAMLDFALAIAAGIDRAQETFTAGVQYVRDFAADVLQALKDLASNALDAALSVGSDIVAGIRQGIASKWQDLKSYVSGLGTGMLDGIKDKLGIRSPSREFAEVGRWSVEGLVVGLDDNADKAIDRSRQLGEQIGQGIRDGLEPVLATVFDGIARGDVGSIGSGLLRQAQGSFSSLLQGAFGAGGGGFGALVSGFKGAVTGIGTALKTGVGLFGKLGGAISSALPIVGAISAAFSFFKGTTRELDAGLRVTVNGFDSLVETFKTIERTRFWGLSKKVRTNYELASAEASDPIQSAIDDIGERVMGLSDVLGLASENIANATFQFEVSTAGKSDQEIQEEITRELARVGNAFASAAIGTYTEFLPDEAEIARLEARLDALNSSELIGGPGEGRLEAERAQIEAARLAAETGREVVHLNEAFAGLQREGEGSLDMLERLVSELRAVNGSLELFGRDLLEVSVNGASAASALVELSGGLDEFAARSEFIFGNLLTDSQQDARLTEIALAQLASTFGDLGIAVPETHAAFMDLLDAQDLNTDAGREAYAAITGVAAAFVQVRGTAQEAAEASERASDLVRQLMEDAAQAAIDAMQEIDDYNREQFTRTTNAQIEVLRDGFSDLSDALSDQIQLARGAVESASDAVRVLSSALDGRTPTESAIASQARSVAAVAAIQRAVSRGVLPDAESLSRIVGDISNNPDAFATREDYLRDFVSTNAVLADAQAIAQNTLTTEEKILAALEQRLSDAATQNDSVLAELQEQINALRDLPVSLAGVLPTGQLSDDATNALFTDADIEKFSELSVQINDLYNSILGRNADVAGLNFYLQQVANGLTLAGIASDLRSSIEASTGNTPGFGGTPPQSAPTQPTNVAAEQARLLAIANGTAAFGGRPTDQIGDLYGNNGVPISRAGYEFWAGLIGQLSYRELETAFLDAARRDGTLGAVPAYRNGTDFHPGGLAYVHSDELINMPRGSSVSTASETRRMFDQSAVVAEISELRRELIQMRRENSAGHSETARQAERGAKVLRDWDQNGQPAQRAAE